MRPRLERIGQAGAPIVVIDDFAGEVGPIVDMAAALAPFPPAETYYPGLRRRITPGDGAAFAYVEQTLRAAGPFIAGGFDVDRFDFIEASFSLVTARPESLSFVQRAPHFDSIDPDHLAILHYLSAPPGSGTAFYRHRSTGIERVNSSCVDRFVSQAERECRVLVGYTNDSNTLFERIGSVEAFPDRLIIYQGCLLHSGVIPSDMAFSADPRSGRLTANLFVRGRRG